MVTLSVTNIRQFGEIFTLPHDLLYATFFRTEKRDISSIAQACKLFYSIILCETQNSKQKGRNIIEGLISVLNPEDDDFLIERLKKMSIEDDYLFDKTMNFCKVQETIFSRIDELSELFCWDIVTVNSLKEYVLQNGDSPMPDLKGFSVSDEVLDIYRTIGLLDDEKSQEDILKDITQLLQKKQFIAARKMMNESQYESNNILGYLNGTDQDFINLEKGIEELAQEYGVKDIEQMIFDQKSIDAGRLLLISFVIASVVLVPLPVVCVSRDSIGSKISVSGVLLFASLGIVGLASLLVYCGKGKKYLNCQSVAAAISDIVQKITCNRPCYR